jgi:hypothetical protein
MNITNIVNLINEKLAGELLAFYELKGFMDNTIDDINDKLGSTYPAFSELGTEEDVYEYFPDRWIRSVVVFGTAWYYFVMDEEGISTAETYQQVYASNLFKMQRDFLSQVPEIYQKGYVDPATLAEDEVAPDPTYGTVDSTSSTTGVSISGINWRL